MTGRPVQHAVVIGGGIAGLLAARTLAEQVSHVTLVERDVDLAAGPRPGAPQGQHVHALLKAGERHLERLFPGLVAELEARGSTRVRFARDIRWFHHGVWAVEGPADLTVQLQSRPLLEDVIRRRVLACPSVEHQPDTTALQPVLDPTGQRVVGLEVRTAGGAVRHLATDLVVDASGRGSRLPTWLAQAGYAPPAEERVAMDLRYASRVYRRAAHGLGQARVLMVSPTAPAETRGGTITPIEDDAWLVTLFGYVGDHPPADADGFLAFARSLSVPDLYDAISTAEPLSDVQRYHFPYARWRHYERLRRLPAGLLAVGDAVCSFDPVFGQGMTVGTFGAHVLAEFVRRDRRAQDTPAYFRALARRLTVPWLLASSEDLRYPATVGRRLFWLGWLQAYAGHVFALTGNDPRAYGVFLGAMHLLDGPAIMAHPTLVRGVLARLLARRATPVAPH